MSDKIKILGFKVEQFKRVALVECAPRQNGLTIIGGGNQAGKTSNLDAIAVALGGERLAPVDPIKDGSEKSVIEVDLSNDLKVKRTFTAKGSYLTVTDPRGMKAGQALLSNLIGIIALDIGKVVHSDDKGRADILRQILGPEIESLEKRLDQAEQERRQQSAVTKAAQARVGNPVEVLADAISVDEIIAERDALQQQGLDYSRLTDAVVGQRKLITDFDLEIKRLEQQIKKLSEQVGLYGADHEREKAKLADLEKSLSETTPPDLGPIEAKLAQARESEQKQSAYARHIEAVEEAKRETKKYDDLTKKVEDLRKKIRNEIAKADLGDENIGTSGGIITYRGKTWRDMASSEKILVADRLARAANPGMGFVLLDGLEVFDERTLAGYIQSLQERGLQAIATRVTDDKGSCDLIITDGVGEVTSPEVKVKK